MNTGMQDYIVNSENKEWNPLIENGHHYQGIFVKSLRYDEVNQRSTTILLRFDAGASYPYHNHPAGEELFVLEGKCVIEGAELKQGDYLYTPPGFKHGVTSGEGCQLLFVVPKEVEIIG